MKTQEKIKDINYAFVSYSHKDKDEVFKYIYAIYKNRYRIWYDEGIDPGTEWADNIAVHLLHAKCVLAFFDANYLASRNCLDEMEYAAANGIPIVLIVLDNTAVPTWMALRCKVFKKRLFTSTDRLVEKIIRKTALSKCFYTDIIMDGTFPFEYMELLGYKKNEELIDRIVASYLYKQDTFITMVNDRGDYKIKLDAVFPYKDKIYLRVTTKETVGTVHKTNFFSYTMGESGEILRLEDDEMYEELYDQYNKVFNYEAAGVIVGVNSKFGRFLQKLPTKVVTAIGLAFVMPLFIISFLQMAHIVEFGEWWVPIKIATRIPSYIGVALLIKPLWQFAFKD